MPLFSFILFCAVAVLLLLLDKRLSQVFLFQLYPPFLLAWSIDNSVCYSSYPHLLFTTYYSVSCTENHSPNPFHSCTYIHSCPSAYLACTFLLHFLAEACNGWDCRQQWKPRQPGERKLHSRCKSLCDSFLILARLSSAGVWWLCWEIQCAVPITWMCWSLRVFHWKWHTSEYL